MVNNLVGKLGEQIKGQISGFVSGMKGAFVSANPALLGPALGGIEKGLKTLVSITRKEQEERRAEKTFNEENQNEQRKLYTDILSEQKESNDYLKKILEALLGKDKEEPWWKNLLAPLFALAKMLKDGFGRLLKALEKLFDLLKGLKLGDLFKNLKLKLGNLLGDIADFFKNLPRKFLGWLGAIADFFKNLPGKFLGWLGAIADFFKNLPGKFLGWLGAIADFFKNLPTKFGGWIDELTKLLKSLPGKLSSWIDNLLRTLNSIFPETSKAIKKFISNLADILKLDNLKLAFDNFRKSISNGFDDLLKSFKESNLFKTFGSLIDNLKALPDTIVAKIKAGIVAIQKTDFVKFIDEFFTSIKTSLNKIPTTLSELIDNIKKSDFAKTLSQFGDSINGKLLNLADNIRNIDILKPIANLSDVINTKLLSIAEAIRLIGTPKGVEQAGDIAKADDAVKAVSQIGDGIKALSFTDSIDQLANAIKGQFNKIIVVVDEKLGEILKVIKDSPAGKAATTIADGLADIAISFVKDVKKLVSAAPAIPAALSAVPTQQVQGLDDVPGRLDQNKILQGRVQGQGLDDVANIMNRNKILLNEATSTLQKLQNLIPEGLMRIIDSVGEALGKVFGFVKGIGGAIADTAKGLGKFLIEIADIDALTKVIGKFLRAIPIIGTIFTFIDGLSTALDTPELARILGKDEKNVSFIDRVKGFLGGFLGSFFGIFDLIGKLFTGKEGDLQKKMTERFVQEFDTIFGKLSTFFKFWGKLIQDFVNSPTMQAIFDKIGSFLSAGFDNFMTGLKGLLDIILGLLSGNLEQAFGGAKDLGNALKNIFMDSLKLVGNAFIGAVNWLINKLPGWLKSSMDISPLSYLEYSNSSSSSANKKEGPQKIESYVQVNPPANPGKVYKDGAPGSGATSGSRPGATAPAPDASGPAAKVQQVKPYTERDLRNEGLNLKLGDVQRPGASLSPALVDLAKDVQRGIPGVTFTGFNDQYHASELSSNSPHKKGLAFDFVIPPNLATNDDYRAQIATSIGKGGARVLDEYARPSARSTGGHFHVDLEGRGVNLFGGKFGGKRQNQSTTQGPPPAPPPAATTPVTSFKYPGDANVADDFRQEETRQAVSASPVTTIVPTIVRDFDYLDETSPDDKPSGKANVTDDFRQEETRQAVSASPVTTIVPTIVRDYDYLDETSPDDKPSGKANDPIFVEDVTGLLVSKKDKERREAEDDKREEENRKKIEEELEQAKKAEKEREKDTDDKLSKFIQRANENDNILNQLTRDRETAEQTRHAQIMAEYDKQRTEREKQIDAENKRYQQERDNLYKQLNQSIKNMYQSSLNSVIGKLGVTGQQAFTRGGESVIDKYLGPTFKKLGENIFGKQQGAGMGMIFQKLMGSYANQAIEQVIAPALGVPSPLLNRALNNYAAGNKKEAYADLVFGMTGVPVDTRTFLEFSTGKVGIENAVAAFSQTLADISTGPMRGLFNLAPNGMGMYNIDLNNPNQDPTVLASQIAANNFHASSQLFGQNVLLAGKTAAEIGVAAAQTEAKITEAAAKNAGKNLQNSVRGAGGAGGGGLFGDLFKSAGNFFSETLGLGKVFGTTPGAGPVADIGGFTYYGSGHELGGAGGGSALNNLLSSAGNFLGYAGGNLIGRTLGIRQDTLPGMFLQAGVNNLSSNFMKTLFTQGAGAAGSGLFDTLSNLYSNLQGGVGASMGNMGLQALSKMFGPSAVSGTAGQFFTGMSTSSQFGSNLYSAATGGPGFVTGVDGAIGAMGGAEIAGQALGALGSAYGAYSMSKALSGGYRGPGNTIAAIGSFLPIPGAPIIAAVVGAAINRLFGRKKAAVESSGITGTLGTGSSTNLQNYQDMFAKGGKYRSDKRYTEHSPADQEMIKGIQNIINKSTTGLEESAKALSLDSSGFKNFTKDIKLDLKGLTEEEQKKALTDMLIDFNEDMLTSVYPQISEYRKEIDGVLEKNIDTFNRLARATVAVDNAFMMLGYNAEEITDVLGIAIGDATSKLSAANVKQQMVDAFGGQEKMQATLQNYIGKVYSPQKLEEIKLKMAQNTMQDIVKENANLATVLDMKGYDTVNAAKDAHLAAFDAAMKAGDFKTANALASSYDAFIEGVRLSIRAKAKEDATSTATGANQQFVDESIAAVTYGPGLVDSVVMQAPGQDVSTNTTTFTSKNPNPDAPVTSPITPITSKNPNPDAPVTSPITPITTVTPIVSFKSEVDRILGNKSLSPPDQASAINQLINSRYGGNRATAIIEYLGRAPTDKEYNDITEFLNLKPSVTPIVSFKSEVDRILGNKSLSPPDQASAINQLINSRYEGNRNAAIMAYLGGREPTDKEYNDIIEFLNLKPSVTPAGVTGDVTNASVTPITPITTVTPITPIVSFKSEVDRILGDESLSSPDKASAFNQLINSRYGGNRATAIIEYLGRAPTDKEYNDITEFLNLKPSVTSPITSSLEDYQSGSSERYSADNPPSPNDQISTGPSTTTNTYLREQYDSSNARNDIINNNNAVIDNSTIISSSPTAVTVMQNDNVRDYHPILGSSNRDLSGGYGSINFIF